MVAAACYLRWAVLREMFTNTRTQTFLQAPLSVDDKKATLFHLEFGTHMVVG